MFEILLFSVLGFILSSNLFIGARDFEQRLERAAGAVVRGEQSAASAAADAGGSPGQTDISIGQVRQRVEQIKLRETPKQFNVGRGAEVQRERSRVSKKEIRPGVFRIQSEGRTRVIQGIEALNKAGFKKSNGNIVKTVAASRESIQKSLFRRMGFKVVTDSKGNIIATKNGRQILISPDDKIIGAPVSAKLDPNFIAAKRIIIVSTLLEGKVISQSIINQKGIEIAKQIKAIEAKGKKEARGRTKLESFARAISKTEQKEVAAQVRFEKLFGKAIGGPRLEKGETFVPRAIRSVLGLPRALTVGLGAQLGLVGGKLVLVGLSLGQSDLAGAKKIGKRLLSLGIKDTPKAIIESNDPRTPEGLVNLLVTVVFIRSIAKAKSKVLAIEKTADPSTIRSEAIKYSESKNNVRSSQSGTFLNRKGQKNKFKVVVDVPKSNTVKVGKYSVIIKKPSGETLIVKKGSVTKRTVSLKPGFAKKIAVVQKKVIIEPKAAIEAKVRQVSSILRDANTRLRNVGVRLDLTSKRAVEVSRIQIDKFTFIQKQRLNKLTRDLLFELKKSKNKITRPVIAKWKSLQGFLAGFKIKVRLISGKAEIKLLLGKSLIKGKVKALATRGKVIVGRVTEPISILRRKVDVQLRFLNKRLEVLNIRLKLTKLRARDTFKSGTSLLRQDIFIRMRRLQIALNKSKGRLTAPIKVKIKQLNVLLNKLNRRLDIVRKAIKIPGVLKSRLGLTVDSAFGNARARFRGRLKVLKVNLKSLDTRIIFTKARVADSILLLKTASRQRIFRKMQLLNNKIKSNVKKGVTKVTAPILRIVSSINRDLSGVNLKFRLQALRVRLDVRKVVGRVKEGVSDISLRLINSYSPFDITVKRLPLKNRRSVKAQLERLNRIETRNNIKFKALRQLVRELISGDVKLTASTRASVRKRFRKLVRPENIPESLLSKEFRGDLSAIRKLKLKEAKNARAQRALAQVVNEIISGKISLTAKSRASLRKILRKKFISKRSLKPLKIPVSFFEKPFKGAALFSREQILVEKIVIKKLNNPFNPTQRLKEIKKLNVQDRKIQKAAVSKGNTNQLSVQIVKTKTKMKKLNKLKVETKKELKFLRGLKKKLGTIKLPLNPQISRSISKLKDSVNIIIKEEQILNQNIKSITEIIQKISKRQKVSEVAKVAQSVKSKRIIKAKQALKLRLLLKTQGKKLLLVVPGFKKLKGSDKNKLKKAILELRFKFVADFLARLAGQKATKKERVKLLKVGRIFTGLERRKLVG